MNNEERTGILKIYVGESDKINGHPLYEEIVFEARNQGIAGATVIKGTMSYGASHSVHTMKIFALSTDLPMTVEVVDNYDRLLEFSKKVNEMMALSQKGGLMIYQDVDVIRYVAGEKYKGMS